MGNNMSISFVPLHVHSEYSLRDSPAKIGDIIQKCLNMGFNACAITEHGNMHSSLPFYKACNNTWRSVVDKISTRYDVPASEVKNLKTLIPDGMSMKTATETIDAVFLLINKYPDFFRDVMNTEIKPILGVEAYVIPTQEMIESENKDVREIRLHITLLAKNKEGYRSIMKAVSESYLYQHKTSRSVFPRMTYKLLEKHFMTDNVVALSGCIHGEIPLLLWDNKYEEAVQKTKYFQNLFGKSNFFLEIQDHGLEKEKKIRSDLIKLSLETGAPLIATNDSHYTEKEHSEIRDMVVAIRLNKTIYDPEFDTDCNELYIKSTEEMLALFSDIPESVSNTQKVADMCNIIIESEQFFPNFKTPKGQSEKETLSLMVKEGLKKHYPEFHKWKSKHKDMFIKRIQYELSVISNLKYEGYLLIVQDFIKKGREDGLVGPGRGSAVGSLVCFLLGITDVNPLKYDLLFERFLNPDRVSFPDIDTDFDTEIRDRVIEYVKETYGTESVCNIATFGTLAARASVRYAGRVTGQPLDLCDKIAKLIPEQPGITLKEAYDASQELRDMCLSSNEANKIFDNAKKLEGLIVQSGTHAAGVIIANCNVSDHIPLMYDKDSKTWITQYDKDVCENDAGFMKMDFLGLENLTIIKRALANIEKNHGKKIDVRKIPMDDKDVINEIFAKGKTKAVFQFESQGMVNMLKRFEPQSLEDIILLNAAFRPGPIQYLDEIIEVKHNRRKPYYIIPQLEKILSITYGKSIYQEQIMRIFNEVAGFSLGEADIIRRAMSKKKMSELERYLPVFEERLIQAGASNRESSAFCQELMEFANYAFNKSHSAAYSVLAYQTAWLKYYYPAEYMASVLASAAMDKIPSYMEECRSIGIPVLPPSVNESDRFFIAGKDGVIRFGLEGIKHAGNCWEDITKERNESGFYKSYQDFIERMIKRNSRAVYKTALKSLILAGALDGLGYNRKQMAECSPEYIDAFKNLISKKTNPKTSEKSLIIAEEKMIKAAISRELQEYDQTYILENEKSLIGFYASGHPLDKYRNVIKQNSELTISDIDDNVNNKYLTIAGHILKVKKLYRKSDKAAMCKFTLEDTTGSIEVICFTKTYAQYKKTIKEGGFVKIRGRIIKDDIGNTTSYQVNAQEISNLVA